MKEVTLAGSGYAEWSANSTAEPSWFERSRFLTAQENEFPFSVSLLSWGLNEEDNIVNFLIKSKEFMDSLGVEYEHLFIDDGSTDCTFEYARAQLQRYPQLRIIRNPCNLGSGWNTRIAVANATKEFLLWQTVDWAYDIEAFRDRLKEFRRFDVLQGVRAPSGSSAETLSSAWRAIQMGTRSDNQVKALISITNYLLVRSLFRLPVLDFQNVTIYPTRLAQSLNLESHSAFTNPEMLLKAHWKGASIQQVSVRFFPRKRGAGKGTRLKTILMSVKEIFYFWFKWVVLGQRSDRQAGRVALP